MSESSVTPVPRGKTWAESSIVRNVTSNWAALIVNVGLSFVIAPVTVQSLGNVYYGIWTLLMQLTGYLWLFDFGVRESVVKYVSQYQATGDRDSINSTVNAAVYIYGIVSLATVLLALVLSAALPYVFNIPADSLPTARITAVLVGGTVAQTFVFNVFVGVLMGLQKFYLMARLSMVVSILRGVLIYTLLKAGFGVVTLAVVQFSMTLGSNLIVYVLCRRNLPYLTVAPRRPTREEASRLLNYGKYVLISNVGDKLVFATDSVVVGMFLPISALTHYAIGGSLIEQFRAFITSMASVLNPLSSSLQARKETAALAEVVGHGARAAVLLGLPFSIGFITLGGTFIGLWMGPEYAGPAGAVLAVLAVGHLFGLPYYSISAVLYGLNRHRIVAYTRIVEGVVNLVLSIVLVQRLGLIGVALGTVIPHVIIVVAVLPTVLARWVPIRLRDYYLNTYVRPLVAAAPFYAACWFIARVVVPASLVSFLAIMAATLVVYIVPCGLLAFSAADRAAILDRLLNRARPRRPVQEVS